MTAPITTPGFAQPDSDLSPAQFERITEMLHAHAGIRMREGKEGLVRARLTKRLRTLGLADFAQYLQYLEQDKSRQEFTEMVDVLTTNKTSFFREASHFDFLREDVFPTLRGPVRLWSAGCSSGEEPYTLAMLCREGLTDIATRDVKILATDISHRVLATAKAGVYPADQMQDVPPAWLQSYWTRRDLNGRLAYAAGRPLTSLIAFAKLNLMARWPMKGPFDAIFCRNVMIYFDKATQQQLIDRYYALLRPGGHLFVGHSESLTGLTHQFRYVQPACYVK
jgi:chemotaxis protein methyltransferase CheR